MFNQKKFTAEFQSLGCLTCTHVSEGKQPYTMICRFEDESWAIFCDNNNHHINEDTEDISDLKYIHMSGIMDVDTFHAIWKTLDTKHAMLLNPHGGGFQIAALDDVL